MCAAEIDKQKPLCKANIIQTKKVAAMQPFLFMKNDLG